MGSNLTIVAVLTGYGLGLLEGLTGGRGKAWQPKPMA